jgi:hypothetical protein
MNGHTGTNGPSQLIQSPPFSYLKAFFIEEKKAIQKLVMFTRITISRICQRLLLKQYYFERKLPLASSCDTTVDAMDRENSCCKVAAS